MNKVPEPPLDSDEFPINVLVQFDDIEETYCDECRRHATEFPTWGLAYGYPAAMYQAAIYCSDCMPESFNAESGEEVLTLSGEPMSKEE